MKPERIRVTRLDYGLMLALFIGALALRLIYVIPAGFDGLYGQDPFAYYDFAAAVRTGQSPAPLFWPLGYPALLVATFLPFGPSAAAGQIASLTLGALLSVLVYMLSRQLGTGRLGAAIAGLLIAICGQAIQSSLVLMADIPALAWATISALCLWRYLQTLRLRWLLLTVLWLALASVTRWLYLWLAPIWALTVLLAWYRYGVSRRLFIRETVFAALTSLLIFAPQFAYSASSPYPTLNHAWVEGWTPANALSRDFVNVDGQFHYAKINAVYYAQPFYDAYYLAPVFAPLLLIGAWSLRRGRLAALLLIGWALLPYMFLAGIPYQNLRFPLIVVPAAAILVGVGAETAWAWVSRRQLRRVITALVVVIGLLGVTQTLVTGRSAIYQFIANQQRDRLVAQWANAQLPPDSTVYTLGLTLILRHYTDLDVRELYYETPETLAANWQRGRQDFLLLNLWDIQNQWAGQGPQIAAYWLRDNRGLVQLGWFRNWTLYRIEG